MRHDALIERLQRYLPLTPDEREGVRAAEGAEVRMVGGDELIVEGGQAGSLFAVQHGWLHESLNLPSGRRQILRFSYPGDLIGTSSLAWSWAATTLTAVTDCIVVTVPKEKLGELFRQQPRLSGLFYAITAAENVALFDRLASISATDALTRLARLILDMLARLRVTAGGVVNSFDLPLTQKDLADALGLTKVHVNRTLAEMTRRGLIARDGKRMRVLNEAEMVAMTGFVDRYAVIDTSWLPLAA